MKYALLVLIIASQAIGSNFVVNTVVDNIDANDKVMSLREAIISVNLNTTQDGRCRDTSKISFNFPSTNASDGETQYYKLKINFKDKAFRNGEVAAPLPPIRCPVIIDGFTQPATKSVSAPQPGYPLIEISGEDLKIGFTEATVPSQTQDDDERYPAGLTFVGRDSVTGTKLARDPSGSTVRGLIINKFPLHAIYLYGVDDSTIVGNFFGLGVNGEGADHYNGTDLNAVHAGVRLEAASRNYIGTTKNDYERKKIHDSNRNYFGSNQAVQLSIVDFNARSNGYGLCDTRIYPLGCRHVEIGSSANIIQGNYIGVNKNGAISGGFCGPKEPFGAGKCTTKSSAVYSAYASVFFQSLPQEASKNSALTDNVIGGVNPGEENLMAGSIASEIIMGARNNIVLGNRFLGSNTKLDQFYPLTLSASKISYTLVTIEPNSPIPSWASQSDFGLVSRTQAGLTIMYQSKLVPQSQKTKGEFYLLEIMTDAKNVSTEMLASVLTPLANARIPVSLVNTTGSFQMLVPKENLDAVKKALEDSGHLVLE